MNSAIRLTKVAGLITLIGLLDLFEKMKPALPVLGLLLLIMAANGIGVQISPGYMEPLTLTPTTLTLVLVPLPLLALAEFSFGYLVSLYAYLMVAGFTLYTSRLAYDHTLARIAMTAALLAFMLPALFIRREPRIQIQLGDRLMEIMLNVAILIAFVVVGLDASYGFRIAGFQESMLARAEIIRPTALEYASNALTCAVLPFAIAFGLDRGRYYMAIVAGIVLAAFFPMLLNKIVLFAPIWTIAVYVLFRFVEPKLSSVLSIAVPLLLTALLYLYSGNETPFFIVDVRMLATPSIAIDRYLAFFSSHQLTHFCQIGVVRHFTGCPYREQLGVLMAGVYGEANFNASFLATEGIASVGMLLTPLSALLCGFVLSLFNAASARLSPALIAASSGAFLNVLMNVPLSVAMVTNGGALLLSLLYLSRKP